MGCAVAAASQVYFWVMVLNASGLAALDGGAPIPRMAPTTTATITTWARPGTRLPLLLMAPLLSLLHGLRHIGCDYIGWDIGYWDSQALTMYPELRCWVASAGEPVKTIRPFSRTYARST